MFNISKKVQSRIKDGIKQYQPILRAAYSRDVNESDTVTIITDILSQVFGYDKYSEITREFQIRGTYCDLAIVTDNKINMLIEVKAIGVHLKEAHIKQATDYAMNEGVDWVLLTNGLEWMIYRIEFGKPVIPRLIYQFNFLDLDYKKKDNIELIFPLTKEASGKSTLETIRAQREALGKHMIAALILSDSYINSLRRDLRKISSNVKIDAEQIKEVIVNELFKRDIFETNELKNAQKRIARHLAKKNPQTRTKKEPDKPIEHNNEEIASTQTTEENEL